MSKEPLSDMPAFPATREMRGSWAASGGAGMTMRQYYKAAALRGLLANPPLMDAAVQLAKAKAVEGINLIAKECGDYADAMLAEDEEHVKK